MGTTHIQITTDARNDLRVWKAKRGLTYTEAIEELLDGYDGDAVEE
jgi:hypothetical protein